MNQNRWVPPITQETIRIKPWVLPENSQRDSMTSIWLTNIVEGFSPISLKEMESAALLNRTDTKFVMPIGQLLKCLAAVRPYYRILTIHGQRMNHYRTLYFDTPDFSFYNLHVNGHTDRYKVRSREYLESGLSFLEVKHKTQKDRTIKDRLSTEEPVFRLNNDSEKWLNGILPCDSQALEPKLWNTFTRITLVGKNDCERVTVDINLAFYANANSTNLDGISVVEVKRDEQCQPSPFLSLMRSQKVMPQGFSKYCIGIALLYDQVKKNRLKSKLMWIEKISKGVRYE